MLRLVKGLTASLVLIASALALPTMAEAAGKIRIAFGDIPSVETLGFLIAVERMREQGVEIETQFLSSDDIAAQAIVAGQADVGAGTPYALIKNVRAPIRMFCQVQVLRFFPIVNTEFYSDWSDLDGEEIVVHSRGSGTEAIMNLMAHRHGIAYKNVSYVPGSEVRAAAMINDVIKATIVDSTNRRILEQKAPGKFMVLPMKDVNASDDVLFANAEFLERESAAVELLVIELLTVWREIKKDPAYVGEARAHYNLLPDLPADLVLDIDPYYLEAAAVGLFPINGGGRSAALDDLEFYTLAGQLDGDPTDFKVGDFWELGPLERALAKIGRM